MKKVFVLLICFALIFVSACAKAPEKKTEVTEEEVATETVEPEEETVTPEEAEETEAPAPAPAPTPAPTPEPTPAEEMVYIWYDIRAGRKYDSFYHRDATCPAVSRNPGAYNRVSKSQAEANGWLPHPDCHGCPPNPGDPGVCVIGGEMTGSPYYHTCSPECPLIAPLMCARTVRLNQAKWLGKTPCPNCSPPPPE